jgi:glycosyltransferase involved in cell wall biosynthesis
VADPGATSVIIPAFNEAGAVDVVVTSLRAVAEWHEVVVVDDGSSDATSEVARRAGATVVRHPYRKGNGAAVKTGIRHATGEFILIIDGDGQHRSEDSTRLVARLGEYDLVVGARASATQATWARWLGNALLNRLASYLTDHAIPDLTSGFRAARRDALVEFLYMLPNGFSTPTTTTLAFMKAGYNVAFEPTSARPRVGKSKIRLLRDGTKFLLIMMRVITIYTPMRIFIVFSGVSFAAGAMYACWTAVTQSHITNSSVLLIALGVVICLLGLVSEQIASLRSSGGDG